jgi:hypothetical protein
MKELAILLTIIFFNFFITLKKMVTYPNMIHDFCVNFNYES